MKGNRVVHPMTRRAMEFDASISRRQFCRMAALSLCAVPVLDGCSREKEPGDISKYYLNRQAELLEMLGKFKPHVQSLLESTRGAEFGRTVMRETQEEFVKLLHQIPYIGGEDNDLTEDLVQSSMVLSFYRVMQRRGRTLEETGRLVFEAYGRLLAGYPDFLFRWGWLWSGKSKSEKAAPVSRERRYPGDWVSVFVEGNGKDFDWGIDYVECGIVKFLRAQGSPELAPYLCLMDLPTFSKAGAGMTRTSTIASGADRCRFRFKKGAPTRLLEPWSVETLKRWNIPNRSA